MDGTDETTRLLRGIRDNQREAVALQREQVALVQAQMERIERLNDRAESLQGRAGKALKAVLWWRSRCSCWSCC